VLSRRDLQKKAVVMGKHNLKLIFGILIGAFFMFLAVRKVDFVQMWQAFEKVNYWYVLPSIAIVFLSHFLRALRWRYLLDPIKRLDLGCLFSSLMIGYMANTLVPAHLGEILRAYVLSKKRGVSASANFATIVMERIIDVLTLLALMVLTIFIYPFPIWMKNSGYIMFAGTLGLLIFMILLKTKSPGMRAIIGHIISPLPERFKNRIEHAVERFISGIGPLKHLRDYPIVFVLSLLIWLCYGLVFFFCLHAFDFVQTFGLPWSASLILLVITTIGVVIPSSPGYVGTYHYLCQISLAMLGVPAGPALSFAAIVHGINFFPILVVGLVFSYHEGIAISKMSEKVSAVEA
jgi:glycosyltransferase 2 family protein